MATHLLTPIVGQRLFHWVVHAIEGIKPKITTPPAP
jgi:hypothetical protein